MNMTEDQKHQAILNNPAVEISLEKSGLKAGLITCASLIVYFMIMKYFNFMHSAVAWGLNFIILYAGIALSYHYYRLKTKPNVEYFPGLMLGAMTTAVSVIPFVMFVYIYFTEGDASLMLSLKDNILFMGEQITPFRIAGATMIEGLCSGFVISFISMQYLRSGFKKTSGEIITQG
jgi:hypothetical protein